MSIHTISRSGCEMSDLGLNAKSDLMNGHNPPPSLFLCSKINILSQP